MSTASLIQKKIFFALLKAMPHVKDSEDTYCEQKPTEEIDILGSNPTW